MKAHENERFPDAGTVTYIIDKQWLSKYKKFVFYDVFKYNVNGSPDPAEDHMTANHPGQIVNANLLHDEAKYLKGTGKLAGFETEYMDTYLHKDAREKQNFEFVSEDIWKFLESRYECDHTIKRFYVSRSSTFMSSLAEVDGRLKWIPVFIVRADDLLHSRVQQDSFHIDYAQISGKKSFNDFKKRITDIVTA